MQANNAAVSIWKRRAPPHQQLELTAAVCSLWCATAKAHKVPKFRCIWPAQWHLIAAHLLLYDYFSFYFWGVRNVCKLPNQNSNFSTFHFAHSLTFNPQMAMVQPRFLLLFAFYSYISVSVDCIHFDQFVWNANKNIDPHADAKFIMHVIPRKITIMHGIQSNIQFIRSACGYQSPQLTNRFRSIK